MPYDPFAHIRYTPNKGRPPGVLPSRSAPPGSAVGMGLIPPSIVLPPQFTGLRLFIDGTGPYYDDTGLLTGGYGVSVDGTGPYLDAASLVGVAVDTQGAYVAA